MFKKFLQTSALTFSLVGLESPESAMAHSTLGIPNALYDGEHQELPKWRIVLNYSDTHGLDSGYKTVKPRKHTEDVDVIKLFDGALDADFLKWSFDPKKIENGEVQMVMHWVGTGKDGENITIDNTPELPLPPTSATNLTWESYFNNLMINTLYDSRTRAFITNVVYPNK